MAQSDNTKKISWTTILLLIAVASLVFLASRQAFNINKQEKATIVLTAKYASDTTYLNKELRVYKDSVAKITGKLQTSNNEIVIYGKRLANLRYTYANQPLKTKSDTVVSFALCDSLITQYDGYIDLLNLNLSMKESLIENGALLLEKTEFKLKMSESLSNALMADNKKVHRQLRGHKIVNYVLGGSVVTLVILAL